MYSIQAKIVYYIVISTKHVYVDMGNTRNKTKLNHSIRKSIEKSIHTK